MIRFLAMVVLIMVASEVFSAPVDRETSIVKIHPMSLDRPHCPACSGITRVYVNVAPWGNSDCRQDAGDLLKEDDHIYSLLLAAWVANKSVRIEVNNSVKPLDDVCKITAIYVN